MSNTNGFHLPSTPIPEHRSNDVTNDSPRTKERLKPKYTILTTINQTGAMKGLVKKQNMIGSNNNLCHKLHPSSATSVHSSEHGSSSVHQNESHYHNVVDHDQTVACHRCSASIHLRRSDLLLSNGGLAKTLYICENCQATPIATRDQLIRPFVFDPKKTLHLNRVKTHSQNQSTLGQIPLTTESNDRSSDKTADVVESSRQQKSSSASNLKRKRPNCPSPPSLSTALSVSSPPGVPDAHLDLLHRLCLSHQSEEFQGPSALSPDSLSQQPNCFICRKSASKNGPSLQCDYCPLIYHLDCLTPLMTSLPLSTEKWMCSNHFEPAFDRCFFKKKTLGRSNRVKIYNHSSIAMSDMIAQDFPPFSRKKNDLPSNTISNTQLESIQVSQIPKAIEDYYSKIHTSEKEINQPAQEETTIESCSLVHELPSVYDPCIWDILQDLLDHLTRDQVYEFSTIDHSRLSPENMLATTPVLHPASTTLDRLDLLLSALNEPQDTSPLSTTKEHASGDTTVTTNTILQSMSDRTPAPLSLPSNASFSLMLDLSQFRLSHAALIDRHSEEVIYIRKHVVWFGSSSLNDICLNHLPVCRHVTERHACLYYDRKQNSFELLNYSEYGTIVNGLRYGLGMASSNDNDDDGRTFENLQRKALENENRDRCSCSTNALSQSAWDGAAQIDQGTVIKIGCHEFLFYRHVVR